MNMNDVMSNVRNPKIKLKRLSELKKYYLSMYRCYMLRLYDLNFISDPTKFDEKAIRQYIQENNIEAMSTPIGEVELSSSHCLFAFDTYKRKRGRDDACDETIQFLYNLYLALKYREYSRHIDEIYTYCGYDTSDSNKITTKMTVKGAYYTQKSGIVFNKALARCISSFEEDTKSININNELWELACNEMEIPAEDRQKDGLFDCRLSHEDEVRNIKGIFNGLFILQDGVYADKLRDWLFSHKWFENTYSINKKGLYDYLFSDKANEIYKIINSVLDSELKDKDVLAVEGSTIYYNVPRTSFKMPFGLFVVLDEDEDEEVIKDSGSLSILGYTGVAYSMDRLDNDCIDYVGCPIIIPNSSINDNIYYYDIEQTDVLVSWFSREDVNVSFGDVSFPENPFKQGTLDSEIYDDFVSAQDSSERLISDIEIESTSDFIKSMKNVYNYLRRID